MSDALFDMEPVTPPEKPSADRRRTGRQQNLIRSGLHPLGGTLHPDSSRSGTRGNEGPRCGTCIYPEKNEREFIKCTRGRTGETGTPSFRRGPKETHAAATDLRLWWPGCSHWTAKTEEEDLS